MNLTKRKIFNRIKEGGYKLTPQRQAVVDAIDLTHERFTPDDIYAAIQGKYPDIGLVTIYRTLNILAELGLVCEVHTGKRRSYVMRRPLGHHHHLVCLYCGTVVDFTNCNLDELEDKLSGETGFKIEGHLLEFSGCCRECLNKSEVANKL